MDAEFPEDALNAVVSVLAASIKQEETEKELVDAQSQNSTVPALAIPPHMRHYNAQLGLAFPPHLHGAAYATRSGLGLGLHLGPELPPPPPLGRPVPASAVALAAPRMPLASIPPSRLQVPTGQAQHREEPIVNAHEGVELEDLRVRAETFRMLNPGCELDKTFLQAFAGRLSEDGHALAEFRCYVKGCTQRNKRRDHILVHVGSHVEHRPFQCPQW